MPSLLLHIPQNSRGMNEGKDLSSIDDKIPTSIKLGEETKRLIELKYRLAEVCIRDYMSEETAECLKVEIGNFGKAYIEMLDAFDELIAANITGNLQLYNEEI